MDAERLSAITWDAWDRRAWDAAYRDARRLHAARPVKRLSSVELGRWFADERKARRAARADARMVDSAFSTTR